MAKLPITIEIENALIKRFKNSAMRYATEVPVRYQENTHIKFGIVDFVTSEHDFNIGIPNITCYEIKVTKSDFKSEHGHTLCGDENYYVVTKELYDDFISKDPNLIPFHIGIMTYSENSLRINRHYNTHNSFTKLKKMTIEDKFRVLDQILMRVIRHG